MSTTTAELVDGTGRSFAYTRLLLPSRVSEWPTAEREHLNAGRRAKFFNALHNEWHVCFACGRDERIDKNIYIQIHHIGHGFRRCDCRSCVMPLCMAWRGRGCHDEVPGNLNKVLWAKWRWDAAHVNWEHLTRCNASWLPEPLAPPRGDYWLPGFDYP
jgi:hypothetical protein